MNFSSWYGDLDFQNGELKEIIEWLKKLFIQEK